MNDAPPQTVIVTTRNTASLTMGIIAIVVGVLALLVGWIPFIGLLAIPVAIIGLLLAGIGVILALVRGFKGITMPLLGGLICVGALILPILSTGGMSAAITEAQKKNSSDVAGQPQTQRTELAKEKATYIQDHVTLYDIEVKYMDSILDGKVPGVLFKLRNTGDRQLDMVKVTFYFKDSAGTVIFEEDFHPVLVSDYSIQNSKPLKAGYVWQMESGKFYTAKSVPREWKEGSVDVKITDIQFSKAL
ncbi:MAG: hypothetical protein JWQ71_1188 [Pedosphaera sp.]|nr:hypothetical protein [Pedosphaera sp.]